MKIKLHTAFAIVIIFVAISPFVFSSGVQSGSAQTLKKSNSSASISSELSEIPIITNEAEYAEFQKQRELRGHPSSSLAAKSNTNSSHSNKSKAVSK